MVPVNVIGKSLDGTPVNRVFFYEEMPSVFDLIELQHGQQGRVVRVEPPSSSATHDGYVYIGEAPTTTPVGMIVGGVVAAALLGGLAYYLYSTSTVATQPLTSSPQGPMGLAVGRG